MCVLASRAMPSTWLQHITAQVVPVISSAEIGILHSSTKSASEEVYWYYQESTEKTKPISLMVKVGHLPKQVRMRFVGLATPETWRLYGDLTEAFKIFKGLNVKHTFLLYPTWNSEVISINFRNGMSDRMLENYSFLSE